MPEGSASRPPRGLDAGRGERIRIRADDAADESSLDAGTEVDPACGRGVSDAMADRGDAPLYQIELSIKRHPGSQIRPSPEHDGDHHGGDLLHGGVSGDQTEASGAGPSSGESSPAGVWNPGLPALCPGRRDQACALQPFEGNRYIPSASRTHIIPAPSLQSINNFWGNS